MKVLDEPEYCDDTNSLGSAKFYLISFHETKNSNRYRYSMLTPVYSNCACYEMERTTVTFPLAFLPCRTDCDGEIVRGNDNFFCVTKKD